MQSPLDESERSMLDHRLHLIGPQGPAHFAFILLGTRWAYISTQQCQFFSTHHCVREKAEIKGCGTGSIYLVPTHAAQ